MASRSGRSRFIDPEVAAYAEDHSSSPDPVRRDLEAATRAGAGEAAGMQIGRDQAMFMEILARATGARRAVEVGTFTGSSALALARGMGPEGRLLCCDVSEEWTAIARAHWERAGVADRIDLQLGPALDTLRGLPAGTVFDLAFLDADKENYVAYYEELVERLRPGGLLLVDNTLWGGRVLDAPGGEAPDADTLAIRALNDRVAADPRVRVVVLTVGDGITLAEKRTGPDG